MEKKEQINPHTSLLLLCAFDFFIGILMVSWFVLCQPFGIDIGDFGL